MLNHENLKRLAAVSGPCLTIIQPLRDSWSQVTKPQTRIVAALQTAARLLEEKGYKPEEREEMLRPLDKLAANTDWSGRTGSFVMFRAPDFTLTSFWPDELAPRVRFAEEFLVLPLLGGLFRERDFWLLALSIKNVRLYRGSSESLTEVPLPAGVASSLAEDEEFDQPDHSLRGRSTAGPSVGGMKGVQFTTAAAQEGEPTYLHDFFKSIDRGIHPLLAGDPHPLILAGVKRELAIYRSVNTWFPLVPGEIHGNAETAAPDFLRKEAAGLLAAYSLKDAETIRHDMDAAAGRGLLVEDPAAAMQAAGMGQVAELILATAAPGFAKREAVVNWAVLATVRNGGKVFLLDAAEPSGGLAAILRYRAPVEAGATSEITSLSA